MVKYNTIENCYICFWGAIQHLFLSLCVYQAFWIVVVFSLFCFCLVSRILAYSSFYFIHHIFFSLCFGNVFVLCCFLISRFYIDMWMHVVYRPAKHCSHVSLYFTKYLYKKMWSLLAEPAQHRPSELALCLWTDGSSCSIKTCDGNVIVWRRLTLHCCCHYHIKISAKTPVICSLHAITQ